MNYAEQKFEDAVSQFVKGNRFNVEPDLAAWGRAAGLTADEIIARVHGADPRGEHSSGIRRMWEKSVMRPRGELPSAPPAPAPARPQPKPKPMKKPSPVVEQFVEQGKRGQCTSAAALMELSPVDVRHMDATEQRVSQFYAMFDRSDLHDLHVGMPRRSGWWMPKCGLDWMRVCDWLKDDAWSVANSKAELVKINPFGPAPKATADNVRAWPHLLMEFDGLPLSDQVSFWYGAIVRKLPVVSIVFSGGKSLHGVVRVDCATRDLFAVALNAAFRTFRTSPDRRYWVDFGKDDTPHPNVEMLKAARLAGCVRSDTGREQRLLYLAKPERPTAPPLPSAPPPAPAPAPAPAPTMPTTPTATNTATEYQPFDELLAEVLARA